jgi:hypothetical protein
MIKEPQPTKLFCFDLNWARYEKPVPFIGPSSAHDWADINPQEYFDLHLAMGNNAFFCPAYTFGGYAFYPSRLGPVAPGPGQELLPRLFELSHQNQLPFWSYFCVGTDVTLSNLMAPWVVPTSRAQVPDNNFGFFGPETPWIDLLCARLTEFLASYPVDWLLLDWFVYGWLKPDFPVQPAWFVEQPFREIIGRPMPAKAEDITPAEGLRYKREVLARLFYRLRDTVKKASPQTRILFNVPYWEAAEPLWVNHPMLNESDGLFAECTRDDVVEWLLKIRKPHQSVMTTIIGRVDDDQCDPDSWRKWFARGCDFFGYAWSTPPLIKPHPSYDKGLEIVRNAFHQMP